MLRAASLRVWLIFSHLTVLALPAVMVVGSGLLADDLNAQTRADLQGQAALLALLVEAELHDARRDGRAPALDDLNLSPLLVRAKQGTLAAVRVVDHTGVVVGTSGEELGEDLSDRDEVALALDGAQGLVVRPREQVATRALDGPSRSATVRLHLAEPIRFDGRTVGAVVLSRTPRGELQALYQLTGPGPTAAAVLLTLAMALAIGRVATRSLTRLEHVARRISDGAFSAVDELDRPQNSRISEVRGLASAFREMADRLQARLAYISEFAGNVSHEFKTPITTLRGTVELLRDDDDLPPAQRARFLDNALIELDRLNRLVGGLLTLARAEAAVPSGRVDLTALARVAAERHRVPLRGEAAPVIGHAEQLAAAVDNLIDNARRHGGATVTLTAWSADGAAGIDVEDDGAGISAANLPRVFDRFFTTARDRGGTGLGLALVKAVAIAHGGDITVTSQPGRTTFRLRLPAA